MPVYPAMALAVAAAVVVLELAVLRTGLFRRGVYWITMAIVFAFMIPVDGWLTKLSAPIVAYDPDDVSGWRPVWDILAEEFCYAFALLTLVLLCWERARCADGGRRGAHVSSLVAFVVAFAAMEGVSYALHRWVMHGPGMGWHASHHAPSHGRWERNDLFPACFSLLGFAVFALAAAGVLPAWAWWAAAGITVYGVAYLVVHELFIHRRAPVARPRRRATCAGCATPTAPTTSTAASRTACCCR